MMGYPLFLRIMKVTLLRLGTRADVERIVKIPPISFFFFFFPILARCAGDRGGKKRSDPG